MGAITDEECGFYDRVVVERVLNRKPPGRQLTGAERLEVARRLHAQGYGASEFQRRLATNGTYASRIMRAVQEEQRCRTAS